MEELAVAVNEALKRWGVVGVVSLTVLGMAWMHYNPSQPYQFQENVLNFHKTLSNQIVALENENTQLKVELSQVREDCLNAVNALESTLDSVLAESAVDLSRSDEIAYLGVVGSDMGDIQCGVDDSLLRFPVEADDNEVGRMVYLQLRDGSLDHGDLHADYTQLLTGLLRPHPVGFGDRCGELPGSETESALR